ncbi:MAG TPA: TetR/AcrR family transcriptional regulator [Paraburkholderia sp.]|jgi:TetR/AcrR family transcriptional repressor of lmrAB and yxaGH operons|nr:TetR/AcrR family transcriptional regulator [Paraburkholderia sp.]
MSDATGSRNEIVDRLFAVFQRRGFDGASLTELSRATGLGKSSLYHHFPDGKAQMAQAVLDRANEVIDSEILQVAQMPGSLKTRIRKIIAILDRVYDSGRAPCVLAGLATSTLAGEVQQGLRKAFGNWGEALEALAKESGMSPVRARHFAEDWIARLQGALIMQAATGDAAPFTRALNSLLELAKGAKVED